MGFFKKIEKEARKHPILTGLLANSPYAPPGLSDALSAERQQHEVHDKVKEIHHHYHDKKHK